MTDVVQIFLEFLEANIHNILFLRKIYPDGIFTLKKKYGVPIHVSIFPELNSYISESLLPIKRLISLNEIKGVDLCFFSKNGIPLEKYVFSVIKIDANKTYKDVVESRDPYLDKLGRSFRALCLKLAASCVHLHQLPEDSSFKIHIHTSESSSISLAEDPIFQDFPWIEADKSEVQINNSVILPVRSLDSEFMSIEVYIEEGT